MSQRNSLCSYLKQTKISFFCFTKLENRRIGLARGEADTNGNREEVGKECGRVNIVQILCTCVYINGKIIPV
jgi:hypothetical protein